jgi:2-dehydro-3-deoxyphosphogluconate aldolase/(4S)-4-hydroxy-2-oxoglutarate aldolase
MHTVLEQIGGIGVVPVIAINDVEKALPLARALKAGGIPCAEVTFRTAQGEEAIRRIAAEMPDVLLGAGTVLTVEQVDKAVAAGARFVVSPGFNPKVVARCQEKGIPVTPGCSSPSDMEKALEFGLDVVKFFPAEQSGGLDFIKAVAAPYTTLKFMPTGGINAGNITKYLAYDRIVACGGSWMVTADLLNAGSFDEITRLCKQAMLTVHGFELGHVGVNVESGEDAVAIARKFEALFSFPVRDGNSSTFAGKAVEVMKGNGRGKNGHIGIATNNIFRAKAYLERQGFTFDDSSLKMDNAGKPVAVYFNDEIAGFGIHLLQK